MKTSVRFLAVLFALVMCMFVVSTAADYTDIDASNEHYDAVELLTTLGVLHGYDDGSFKPNEPVQRDEMAKMIFIMGTAFDNAGDGVKLFPDVSEKHWAAGFITWCHTKDIVGGYEDGTFRPDDNITYDESLKMVSAMLGYNDFDPELWPADVRTLALKQLDLGENIPETVEGDTVITRAQAAQIVYNAFYKTMASTKTITYYEEGFVEEDGTTPAKREVKVEVAMTLAADVWNCDVYEYKIVASENYAVNDTTKGITGVTKTGEEDVIKVWDGETVSELDLEEFGLEAYTGNTDSLIGFTLSKITKDGEDFAVSGIKGTRYEGVSVGYVSAKSGDSPTWKSGSTYWYADRLNVNGVLYEEDNFWNLRAVYVDKSSTGDPVFNVMDRPIAFSDTFSNASHTWDTPLGTYTGVTNANAPYMNQEVHFNSYLLGYTKRVWGIDSEGDGVIDFLFLKFNQPFKVTKVLDFTNNGVKDQMITIEDIYNSENVYTIYKSNTIFAGELKEDDIFVGARFGNKLYVETVVQPQTSHVTAMSGSVTMEGIGKLSIGANFVAHPASTVKSSIFDTSEPEYWLNKKADGTYNELTVWVYKGSYMIYSSAYTGEEQTSYDKAILLYVDEKTDRQLDKSTNKFVTFYPAYLLINGKEEAVNLNPDNAINGSSGDYVSADGSPYRATINADSTLNNVYMLVTYTKDADGYYTLTSSNDSLLDSEDKLLELVVPASENPTLVYNETTGLYKLVTDSKTYPLVDVSEDTYLYYNYKKESTGDYKYIGFYTSDNLGSEFTEAAFASDVYLSYNEDDGFYTIQTGILAAEIEEAGDDDSIDVNEDGRIIYMATENSAMVAHNGEVVYEHTLMNPATGEITVVIQDKTTVAEGALALEAGKFYAWDGTEKDYVRVTSNGATSAVATLNSYIIARVDTARNIIYTREGEYAEGIKLDDDMVIVAFDDDMNRYELNVSDIEQFKDIFDEVNKVMYVVFVTYEDEEGEPQIAYVITDYAERVEKADGTVEPKIHYNTVNCIIGY